MLVFAHASDLLAAHVGLYGLSAQDRRRRVAASPAPRLSCAGPRSLSCSRTSRALYVVRVLHTSAHRSGAHCMTAALCTVSSLTLASMFSAAERRLSCAARRFPFLSPAMHVFACPGLRCMPPVCSARLDSTTFMRYRPAACSHTRACCFPSLSRRCRASQRRRVLLARHIHDEACVRACERAAGGTRRAVSALSAG